MNSIPPATTESIKIEKASADALGYVLSTWGKAQEALTIGEMPSDPQSRDEFIRWRDSLSFLKKFARIQAQLIKRSTVLVALDGDRIAGFCVYENRENIRPLLHWIGVRNTYRRRGIASTMLRETGVRDKMVVTSLSPSLKYLGLTSRYVPFWLLIS